MAERQTLDREEHFVSKTEVQMCQQHHQFILMLRGKSSFCLTWVLFEWWVILINKGEERFYGTTWKFNLKTSLKHNICIN